MEDRPPKPGEGAFGGLGFDPRPWPLVILMLLGLWVVYLGLRPRHPDPAPAPEPSKPTELDARPAAAAIPPSLPEMKQTLEQGIRLTFTQAGTFKYLCTIHPFMTATVTVTR